MSEILRYRIPTFAERQRLLAEARMLQARCLEDGLRATGRAFRRLGAAFVAGQRRRALMGELSRLTDRDLRDMGLSRADFEAIADGRYAGSTQTDAIAPRAAANAGPASVSAPANDAVAPAEAPARRAA